jgi:hypothetical protein
MRSVTMTESVKVAACGRIENETGGQSRCYGKDHDRTHDRGRIGQNGHARRVDRVQAMVRDRGHGRRRRDGEGQRQEEGKS